MNQTVPISCFLSLRAKCILIVLGVLAVVIGTALGVAVVIDWAIRMAG